MKTLASLGLESLLIELDEARGASATRPTSHELVMSGKARRRLCLDCVRPTFMSGSAI